MEFAERLSDTPATEEVLQKLGLDEDTVKVLEHALYMFMKNFTAGHAKEVIQHGVCNGIDAWRKLYRDQLPLADDKRNIRTDDRIHEAQRASQRKRLAQNDD